MQEFLRFVFTLEPISFAGVVWLFGWGSILLHAIKRKAVTKVLFRHPGFMFGDFIMLPLAGFLMAVFYRDAGFVFSQKISLIGLMLASAYTLMVTPLPFKGRHINAWAIPHSAFIWLFSYLLFNFFLGALLVLLSDSTPYRILLYLGVIAALLLHGLLMLLFWPKRIP